MYRAVFRSLGIKMAVDEEEEVEVVVEEEEDMYMYDDVRRMLGYAPPKYCICRSEYDPFR